MRSRRQGSWLIGCAVLGCAGTAIGQTVYKWTDNRGVVHFADIPPAKTSNVQQIEMPAAPAGAPRVEDRPTAGTEPGAAAVVAPATEDAPASPAKVVVTTHQSPHTAADAIRVTGEVRNVGGTTAREVSVKVNTTDDTQGNPCLAENAPVKPATLRPGEVGTFDLELESPCLFGEAGVTTNPIWQ